MSTAGIIFSNLHDKSIPELTRRRTMASIPFACRYRLIDFPLSAMTNAGIKNVSVITHYNYYSLMEHLGSGKDYDLARRSGGVKILPPYVTAYANDTNRLYNTRLEALKSISSTINSLEADTVVLCDCDLICNIDLKSLLDRFSKSGADMLIVSKKCSENTDTSSTTILEHKDGSLCDIFVRRKKKGMDYSVSLNIFIVKTEFLRLAVLDASAHNYTSFRHDIIAKSIGRANILVCDHDGFSGTISSLSDYYSLSMSLISDGNSRDSVFSVPERPICTRVRNSPPTKYLPDASVKNSLIADGCIIEGSVENCMLFRGVRIGKNSIVKNSILFQDTFIGDGVSVNYAVADKNVSFTNGCVVSGHPSVPYYIDRGMML